ncbi:MAG: class I SAM-dependent methyltransferase [Spirochaetes bacterium]|nr:MAG: class I SAM-dependent methyltransferase [Spirochaetota bacterium]
MKKKITVALSLLGALVLTWFIIDAFTGNRLTETFDRIYTEGRWGKDAQDRGTSGTGSTVEITREYRAWIEEFIRKNKVASVVDAGCGDWNFSRLIDWGGARYLGIDISNVVIERLKKNYRGDRFEFQMGDITGDLPAADLLICKDVLQHLPNELVKKFIRNNLKKGKYRWALITNDALTADGNKDINIGDYRRIDLSRPPFDVRGLVDLPVKFGNESTKKAQLLKLGD